MTRHTPTAVGLGPIVVPEAVEIDLEALARGGKLFAVRDCGCMDEPVSDRAFTLTGPHEPMPPRSDFTDNCAFIRHYCLKHWLQRQGVRELTDAQWRERARWMQERAPSWRAETEALWRRSVAGSPSIEVLHIDDWLPLQVAAAEWEHQHGRQA